MKGWDYYVLRVLVFPDFFLVLPAFKPSVLPSITLLQAEVCVYGTVLYIFCICQRSKAAE